MALLLTAVGKSEGHSERLSRFWVQTASPILTQETIQLVLDRVQLIQLIPRRGMGSIALHITQVEAAATIDAVLLPLALRFSECSVLYRTIVSVDSLIDSRHSRQAGIAFWSSVVLDQELADTSVIIIQHFLTRDHFERRIRSVSFRIQANNTGRSYVW